MCEANHEPTQCSTAVSSSQSRTAQIHSGSGRPSGRQTIARERTERQQRGRRQRTQVNEIIRHGKIEVAKTEKEAIVSGWSSRSCTEKAPRGESTGIVRRAEPPRVETDAHSLSRVPRPPLRLRVSLAKPPTAAAEQARTSTPVASIFCRRASRRSFVHFAELRKTPSSHRQLPEWRPGGGRRANHFLKPNAPLVCLSARARFSLASGRREKKVWVATDGGGGSVGSAVVGEVQNPHMISIFS